jgi:serine/threonine protein phosphatase 1
LLYAVGDIHGQREKLDELLATLPLQEDDRLVFLGDYVDRGPESYGVVERLIALERERDCIFLMGNHESMFLDFLGLRDERHFGGDAFLTNGGDRTLASYGFFEAPPGAFELPEDHAAFFSKLRLYHREGDYLFVHAGLSARWLDETDLDYVLRRSRSEDLLWSRAIGDLPHRLGVTVVYGHTPDPSLQVRWNEPFSIGIDTGAAFGGPLTAIRLPDETLFQV